MQSMASTVQLLIVLLGLFTSAASHSLKSADTDAETRAKQTLGGFFNYYWKEDPNNKDVQFFFACGEVGYQGPTLSLDQCSCFNPDVCVNCYRWWSAVSLESIATYGLYMNTTNHSSVADTTYDHSPYNANWKPKNAFIDDFLWYGIAYLRVYEWLQVN